MAFSNYQQVIQAGQSLYKNRDYEAARKAFIHAIDLKPDGPEGAAGLAKVLLIQGAYEDAKKLYGAAFNKGLEKSAEHLTDLAICCAFTGDRQNARTLMEGAIAVDPSYEPAYGGLARHCLIMGDYAAAERYATEGLRLFPDSVPCFEARALARLSMLNLDGAYADAEAVLKLNAKSVDGMMCKASVLMARGELPGGKQLLLKAQQIEPANTEVIMALGNAHLIGREMVEAEICFRKALELQPLNWRVYQCLGSLELMTGKPTEGLMHVDTALRLQDVPVLHCLRGTMLTQFSRFDEAAGEFATATRLNPIDVISWISLAEIEARNPKQREQAIQHARKVLAMDSAGPTGERAKRLLEKLAG